MRRRASGPAAIGHRGLIPNRDIDDDAAASGEVDTEVRAEVPLAQLTGPVGSPAGGDCLGTL